MASSIRVSDRSQSNRPSPPFGSCSKTESPRMTVAPGCTLTRTPLVQLRARKQDDGIGQILEKRPSLCMELDPLARGLRRHAVHDGGSAPTRRAQRHLRLRRYAAAESSPSKMPPEAALQVHRGHAGRIAGHLQAPADVKGIADALAMHIGLPRSRRTQTPAPPAPFAVAEAPARAGSRREDSPVEQHLAGNGFDDRVDAVALRAVGQRAPAGRRAPGRLRAPCDRGRHSRIARGRSC